MTSIEKLYPRNDDLLEAFFPDGAVVSRRKTAGGGSAINDERAWADLGRLAEADSATFFAVVMHHKTLPAVLSQCLQRAEASLASSTRVDRIPKAHTQTLSEVLLRIFGCPPVPIGGTADFSAWCARLLVLFPPTRWMSMAFILCRQHPQAASVSLSALLLQVPTHLPAFKAVSMTWCDEVGALADRCTAEAKRGRYMRTNGDILALFERAYRLVQALWSLLECAPMAVTPFAAAEELLQALDTIVTAVCPLLQYFALHCADLAPTRHRLSRINAFVLNAALRAASILILFTPMTPLSADTAGGSPLKAEYAVPRLVDAADSATCEQFEAHFPPEAPPTFLVTLCKGYRAALAAVCPLCATEDDEADHQRRKQQGAKKRSQRRPGGDNKTVFEVGAAALGELLPPLVQAAEGRVEAVGELAVRFVQLLMVGLVEQGASVDDWIRRALVSPAEGVTLGARNAFTASAKKPTPSADHAAPRATASAASTEDADLAAAIAASLADVGQAVSSPPPPPPPAAVSDPRVAMVLEFVPTLDANIVPALLAYYNNDVETLIFEASAGNLPPHIVSAPANTPQAAAQAPSPREVSAPTAALDMTKVLQRVRDGAAEEDGDGGVSFATDVFSLLMGRDGDHHDGEHDDGQYDGSDAAGGDMDLGAGMGGVVYSSEGSHLFGLPAMDEDLKARTIMLAQALMYEDERDDTYEVAAEEGRFLGKRLDANGAASSDDEVTVRRGTYQDPIDDADGQPGLGRSAYRKGDHAGAAGAAPQQQQGPRYAQKAATVRVGADGRNARGTKDKHHEKAKAASSRGQKAARAAGGGADANDHKPSGGGGGGGSAPGGGRGGGAGNAPSGGAAAKKRESKHSKKDMANMIKTAKMN